MTDIDIILPFYNGSKYVAEQLQSVIKIQYEDLNLRWIIINDCSNEIETAYLKTIVPANTLYIENESNLGVIKSIERGLELSTAKFIMLCDQDDVWLDDKIKCSLQEINKLNIDIPAMIFTDLIVCDSDLKTIRPSMHKYYGHKYHDIKSSLLLHNIVTGCTIIMNREILKIALPFPEKISMHDHWLALCAAYAGQISYLDKTTMLYRQHGQNQVGAPTKNIFLKILNLRQFLQKIRWNLITKVQMAFELRDRLKQNSISFHSIDAITNDLYDRKFIRLIRKNVITGNFLRIAMTVLILCTMKRHQFKV